MSQKAQAQLTQGGANWPHSLVGRPGLGANEIMLSTCHVKSVRIGTEVGKLVRP
jgi:hypothetical protein